MQIGSQIIHWIHYNIWTVFGKEKNEDIDNTFYWLRYLNLAKCHKNHMCMWFPRMKGENLDFLSFLFFAAFELAKRTRIIKNTWY